MRIVFDHTIFLHPYCENMKYSVLQASQYQEKRQVRASCSPRLGGLELLLDPFPELFLGNIYGRIHFVSLNQKFQQCLGCCECMESRQEGVPVCFLLFHL